MASHILFIVLVTAAPEALSLAALLLLRLQHFLQLHLLLLHPYRVAERTADVAAPVGYEVNSTEEAAATLVGLGQAF